MKHYLLCYTVIAASLVCVAAVHACDTGTVRDAAFHAQREFFRLGMVFEDEDENARAHYERLAAWFDEHGMELNLRLEQLRPDDAIVLRHGYGLDEPPGTISVTLLAGMHPAIKRPVTFHEWMPTPPLALLEGLKANPVLAAIARETPDYWGLILYAPGNGPSRRRAVESAVRYWRENHAPGVGLLELDRNDPDNAWFCMVAGIASDGEDWAGVVFAKGKLLLPVLTGEAITQAELGRLLHRLTVPCTCLQQAMTFGLDIPMYWDDDANTEFTALASPIGYMEMTLDDRMASVFAELPDEDREIRIAAATAVGGAASIVFVSLAVLRRRYRKRRS